MKKARHFKASEHGISKPLGDRPARPRLPASWDRKMSATIGAGIAVFDGCSIEWTVLYDEVIVVLEGTFRLKLGKDFRPRSHRSSSPAM